MNTLDLEEIKKCPIQFVLAINDTFNAISGKWKMPIIGLLLYEKKRFNQLEKGIPKITPRMLSKELKDLEANGIVKRTTYDSSPVMVEYELTKSGQSLKQLIEMMIEWGLQHRKNIINNPS